MRLEVFMVQVVLLSKCECVLTLVVNALVHIDKGLCQMRCYSAQSIYSLLHC